MITDTSSPSYGLLQTLYVRDGLFTNGTYIAVAMASYYGEVGDKFRITLSSGQVFYAIMVDTKRDQDVDRCYAHKTDGSVIEFVVDTKTLDAQVKLTGSLDCIYKGSIKKIERLAYDKKND